ncbi:hypothetical protein HMPREF9257_0888 [Eremococcus coleocola ACS-139-V-Col8]|uniref:Uncharacterized protein n=1 Tax=Eremococcus coleocola ACS-139-V-Col8 TaxID=908337 RepID=E4KLQ6_9LACT|nr:metalloprotease family protein [Eremococcus coleocola]EFR32083.1 hypothetical protein HMPREF9257_0888 [Eremococcus coleocola ACS-139-V-Col8]
MPLFIVGLIPIIIGLMHGSILISLLGTVMTAGAVGDLMIVAKILGYKSSRTKQLILDHPTEGGCIIFEKG